MATSEQFSTMLKVYMPYELLVEEMKKRNYFWSKVKKDPNWYGGTLDVPFEGGEYSSLSFGALTDSTDIAQATPVLGTVSTQPELWGTMLFYEKDLDRHGSLERSFLKILPDKLTQFTQRMAERISLTLLNGYIAKVTDATDAATGVMVVDHPERFTIGEKVTLDDDNSSAAEYYVTAVDVAGAKSITLSATRGGGAADVSAYSVAQNAKLYLPNGDDSGFTSLANSLLSSTNGGGSTLYGQTKTTYPFLQALQHSGAAFTAENTIDKLYDVFFTQKALGKGNPTEILMNMTHFKNCSKALENNRRFSVTDKKAGYGFMSIEMIGGSEKMMITGIRDMAATEMFIMDWDGLKFHGNNFFERKRHLDGNEFYLTRATTGYTYIVDVKFFGDLIVNKPSHFGVVHSIPSSIT